MKTIMRPLIFLVQDAIIIGTDGEETV
jgi:hypothetical protein